MSDPAKYRSREEVDKVRNERDPIELIRHRIIDAHLASEDELKAIDKEIRETIAEAAEFAQASPEPEEGELYKDVLSA